MTDEEIVSFYNEMVKMFGTIPNPEHHPRQFKHYVGLYNHIKQNEKKTEFENVKNMS